MSVGLALYRMATFGLAPFVPGILDGREARGKEPAGRRGERLARNLPPRPEGRLVWVHGASLGEMRLLYRLCKAMASAAPDLSFLATSQTATSAGLAPAALPERAIHQMAPVDVPAVARRFANHWQPDLCIFAEGEIWPNLLAGAARSQARLALVNARMTARTITGWSRWPDAARSVFGRFDLILPADTFTARGLSGLTGREIAPFGTLKALVPEDTAPGGADGMAPLPWSGPVLLGASTHDGEEAMLIETLAALPDGAKLILAPRHPERGDAVEALARTQGLSVARRSRGDAVTPGTTVLLADTVGEMAAWYALADHVYLGGAHRPGPGGHNPLEPLAAGKPVICGPHMTNFTDVADELAGIGALRTARTAGDVARLCREPPDMDAGAVAAYFERGRFRFAEATRLLLALLPAGGRP